jgi:hypothetical protein
LWWVGFASRSPAAASVQPTYDWHLAHQDPSAWTTELEVRPFKEKF